ncbi:MAG: DUF421 domain-containing protein [Acetobacteraceae bacterium]|nr:DUF421 domain-containing protein [Acetobacteraceae bacterium]
MLHTGLNLFVRALVMYFFILLVTRLLGKREIGQVSPFDFVVAIMLGELAVIAVENTRLPLWQAGLPILAMAGAHVGLAFLCMKSNLARRWLSGVPTVLIENGRIVEKNLRSLRYNLNDLLASLREKGVGNIADVEFAILENTGKLSVLPRSQRRPLQPRDLGLPSPYEGLADVVVVDGKPVAATLRRLNLDEDWLRRELARQGVSDPRQVLLATLDTQGGLFVSRKGETSKREVE